MLQNSLFFCLILVVVEREMEGMASLWMYQESINELKHKLLCTTFELESARTDAKEEIRKNEENINQLLRLLKIACQERDEARDQLRRLLNEVFLSTPAVISPALPHVQPENFPPKASKATSSITKSNSLSEPYNHHTYGSSSFGCFFDAVSSMDLSNTNIADSSNLGVPKQPFVQKCSGSISMGIVSSGTTMIDRALAAINNLVKGKPLPQKGKLLRTVVEAGPLLQTLLVAGPLPRWQNPPPLQPLKIPSIPNKEGDPGLVKQKAVVNLNCAVQSWPSSSYLEISHCSQNSSSSMLNFVWGSGSRLDNRRPLSDTSNWDFIHNQISSGKRRRCQ